MHGTLLHLGGKHSRFCDVVNQSPFFRLLPANALHVGGPFETNNFVGVVAFLLLAYSLYYFAKKPLDKPKE